MMDSIHFPYSQDPTNARLNRLDAVYAAMTERAKGFVSREAVAEVLAAVDAASLSPGPMTDAQQRVSEFAAAYANRRGLDPEQVYSLGTAGEPLVLRLSDLVALASPQVAPDPEMVMDEHGMLGLEGKAAFAKHCSVLCEHVEESKWPIVEDSIVALGVALQNRSAVFAAPAPVAPQDDARDAAEVLTDEQIDAVSEAHAMDNDGSLLCVGRPNMRRFARAILALSAPAAKPADGSAR